MDYTRHYDRLIDRARERVLAGYSERHHVVPRCLGGGNSKDNLVRLTPEEHYVAHQLLVKMHPGNHRLVWALMNMTGKTSRLQRSNKIYGWVRRQFALMISVTRKGKKMPEGFGAAVAARLTGMKRGPHSAETRAKMSAASKGRKKSVAHCAAMSAVRIGKPLHRSAAGRRNQADAMRHVNRDRDKSFMRTEQYRHAKAEEMRRVWEKRRTGAMVTPNVFGRVAGAAGG